MESLEQNNKSNLHEHLREGVSPIMTCVGTPRDFEGDPEFDKYIKEKGFSEKHNVDYNALPETLDQRGFRNGGKCSYVISKVDGVDKFSSGYWDCTGLVVSGIEKGTGKNISFLSHQDPKVVLKRKLDQFRADLEAEILEIKERCEDGTIDAVVYGGRYSYVRELEEGHPARDMYINDYLNSIDLITKEVKDGLGFEPVVVAGPKTNPGMDSVFFDNEKKRLYLLRRMTRIDATDPDFKGGFRGGDIEEEKGNWEAGKWSLPNNWF